MLSLWVQVFARSSKFSLFDPAKEMVYIEMDADIKGKGKAAVDLLGSQIGKTGASWATQALLLIFGSIRAAMPLVAAVYVGVISAWLVAVNRLALQMKVLAMPRIPRLLGLNTCNALQADSFRNNLSSFILQGVVLQRGVLSCSSTLSHLGLF